MASSTDGAVIGNMLSAAGMTVRRADPARQ
jgi:hypothetical protein